MPPGRLLRNVYDAHTVVMVWTMFCSPLHVSRTNMFSTPFCTLAPRLEAKDAKETYWPVAQGMVEEVEQEVLTLGFSLGALAAVEPLDV